MGLFKDEKIIETPVFLEHDQYPLKLGRDKKIFLTSVFQKNKCRTDAERERSVIPRFLENDNYPLKIGAAQTSSLGPVSMKTNQNQIQKDAVRREFRNSVTLPRQKDRDQLITENKAPKFESSVGSDGSSSFRSGRDSPSDCGINVVSDDPNEFEAFFMHDGQSRRNILLLRNVLLKRRATSSGATSDVQLKGDYSVPSGSPPRQLPTNLTVHQVHYSNQRQGVEPAMTSRCHSRVSIPRSCSSSVEGRPRWTWSAAVDKKPPPDTRIQYPFLHNGRITRPQVISREPPSSGNSPARSQTHFW